MIRKIFLAYFLFTSVLAAEQTDLLQQAKSEELVLQAREAFRCQEQKKAVELFLEALANTNKQPEAAELSTDEKSLYEKALELYLSGGASNAKAVSDKIIETYAATVSQHPDYYYLGFLVALAYANKSDFDKFFPLFFRSYQAAPNHFLAYKTKAILYIKLFEKEPAGEKKEILRQKILQQISLAVDLFPSDYMLNKIAIAYSCPQNKQQVVIGIIEKILARNEAIPRSDVLFYVEQAIEVNQKSLAQALVDKARLFYQNSRIVDTAQAVIDTH